MNEQRSKNRFWPWVLGAGVVLILGGVGVYFLQRDQGESRGVIVATPPPVER